MASGDVILLLLLEFIEDMVYGDGEFTIALVDELKAISP
jgi:hypothetical protein